MGLIVGRRIKGLRDPENFHMLSGDELKRVHELLYDMALDIAAYCMVKGLTVSLSGGSVLGAVRHKGIIPWDDDIDLNMMRPDYDVFIKEFPSVFQDKYVVQIPGVTPDYYMPMARVRLKGTVVRDIFDPGKGENGLFIDVHPIESVPNFAPLRLIQGVASLGLMYCMTCKRYWRFHEEYDEIAAHQDDDFINTIKTKEKLGKLFSFVSCESLASAIQYVNSACRSQKTRFVSIPAGRNFYFKEMTTRETHVPFKECDFEGLPWKIPGDFDTYLAGLYGDYMKIPDEQHRETHGYVEFDLGRFA